MKKAMIFIVVMLVLSACTIKAATSDDSMSTRVAQILTQEYVEPTATGIPTLVAATSTVEIVKTNTPQVVVIVTATHTPTVLLPEETEPVEETEVVTEEPTEEPTEKPDATEAPDGDPREELGKPDATDPMETNETWNWPKGDQEYTSVDFNDGFMELSGNQPEAGWRLPMVPALTDMYVEMTARNGKCTGDDNFGIIFHIPVFNKPDQGYLFSVSCDGNYRLTDWNGKVYPHGKGWRLVDWTPSEHINTGKGAVNRIGVMVKGNNFYLYSNGYLLNDTIPLEDTDSPYTKGHFGVFVAARQTEGFKIFIDEMSYWDSAFKP